MNITTIGFDLAKNVFQVHGTNEHGKAVLRKALRRAQVMDFFAKLQPCLIGMEACGSAHFWARKLTHGSRICRKPLALRFPLSKPATLPRQERVSEIWVCRYCSMQPQQPIGNRELMLSHRGKLLSRRPLQLSCSRSSAL
jgi:hypothetical protein